MAGKRPMIDRFVKRAVVAWGIYFPNEPFTAKDIEAFMRHHKMQLNQSRGSISSPVIGNRLAYWSKAGLIPQLKLISTSPNTFVMEVEE